MGFPSRTLPSCVVEALDVTPSRRSSLTSLVEEPSLIKRSKTCRTVFASFSFPGIHTVHLEDIGMRDMHRFP
jgi:hypothetical protein